MEDYAEWLAEEMAKAGGRFAPNKLLDPAFARTVKNKLRNLDTGLAVAHEVRIEVPQQEVRYICVSWEECVNGAWVPRREKRESTRGDLPNKVFTGSGKLGSRDVEQLIAAARSHYQTLARNDESIDSFCP